ncbi:AAA family ATPase [Nocardia sp. NPDC052566]|uniref:AAA family ATPase n=1 Tax=Nocardia sp. NPDC052566 TaxID=3364330 RepID=UPI0037C9722A
MLAFGYAQWRRDSGTATDAEAHFVLHRSQDDLVRISSARGALKRHQPAAPVDGFLDAAFQLANDVEQSRDGVGDPATLPLRCVLLPDAIPDRSLVTSFLTAYFDSEDDHTVDGFLRALLDTPQSTTATTTLPEPAVDDHPALGGPTEFTTPDGSPYIARTVGGLSDVLVVRKALSLGLNVALAGEPGSGKTTLVQVAAPQLVVHTFHGESSTEDVIGRFVPDQHAPSGFSWKDGPLLIAMRSGLPFLADELPRAPREVQQVFFSVMDHRRCYGDLANPHIGEVVAAPGFAVAITYNPGSGFGMDDALFDRIAFTISVPTDLNTAAQLGVPSEFVDAARILAADSAVAAVTGREAPWVPTLRSLLKARDVAEHFGLRFAASALVSACPDELQRLAIARALENKLGLGEGAIVELTTVS